VLSLDPDKNHEALKAKATELYQYAAKHGRGDNPMLNPTLAKSTSMEALKVLEKANEYGREVNPVAAFFGMKGKLKRLDEEKARQKQSEAVQGLIVAARNMKGVNTQIDTNRSIPGWTDKHEAMFQENYAKLQESAAKNGWDAAEVSSRANRLRNFVLTQGGK